MISLCAISYYFVGSSAFLIRIMLKKDPIQSYEENRPNTMFWFEIEFLSLGTWIILSFIYLYSNFSVFCLYLFFFQYSMYNVQCTVFDKILPRNELFNSIIFAQLTLNNSSSSISEIEVKDTE